MRELMLDIQGSPRGVNSPCCGEESCEEELSVLPRHTKVIVTGNNRTKSVLVGLHGVVKKAVGLGGWHWLVLTNGLEVKLQRNALSVIEAPTGQEEDDSEDLLSSKSNQGTKSYDSHAAVDYPKPFKSKVRVQQRLIAMPKASNKNQAVDVSSTGSKTASTGLLKIDFRKLETATLLKYWNHFNLVELGQNPSKEQLVEAVESHFISQQLDELQVIAAFVQAAKRLKIVYS
eukprot:c17842_g1_i1 orf=430-1122(-)